MSTPRVVLATRNRHKVEELQRILQATGIEVSLLQLGDTPDAVQAPEVAETGATFTDNALLKAHAVSEATSLPAVADDSGLAVDALNGMPGVLSARWSGRQHDDRANLNLLLAQLEDVPDERRGARFVCAAALVLPGGEQRVVEAFVGGSIIRESRGTNGFGYDPIFIPEGETRTLAEMSSPEKDAISHRGRAFREIAPQIGLLLAAVPEEDWAAR
jgi:XTP/dITP diphosphohydrolase